MGNTDGQAGNNRLTRLLVYFFASLGLLMFIVTVTHLVSWWGGELAGPWNAPKGDVLIVLGGSMGERGILGDNSYLRAEYAILAFREGGFRLIVLSGGGAHHPVSDAMRDFLSCQGVPRDAVLTETASSSTRENALFTKELVGNAPGKKLLMTSDFHMFRAYRVFRKAGLDEIGVAVLRCNDLASRLPTWRRNRLPGAARVRTLLICHDGAALDQVGLVALHETRRQVLRRIRREVRRVGVLRMLDIATFRLYYRLFVARKDHAWEQQELRELTSLYPEPPRGTPVLHSSSPNTAEAEQFIKKLRPDLIVARCKFLLKETVFSIPPKGTLVMHPGICPEYRNAHTPAERLLSAQDRGRVGPAGHRTARPASHLRTQRLKREWDLPLSHVAIQRIWRQHGLIHPRRRKYQRKQDLAAWKATFRLFQQISADTKDLGDISHYWPQM